MPLLGAQSAKAYAMRRQDTSGIKKVTYLITRLRAIVEETEEFCIDRGKKKKKYQVPSLVHFRFIIYNDTSLLFLRNFLY